ncbi:ATP-binding protein [Nocardioides sp.]|uniref:ATP-binding protein n=1 Tax=Nocardioides sp. TaxID=35761 RepID=UPI0039E23192
MAYQRRVIDGVLDEVFPGLPAIALEGAKGVGKTATASQRVTTVLALDDPLQLEALAANLDLVVQVEPPVFVDEWQLHPPVWDRIRRAVDAAPDRARFLLAGSARVAPGARVHSGAGRIVRMVMRPLAMSERSLVEPTVSLRELLAGGRPEIGGSSPLTVPDYVEEIVRSGFPGIRGMSGRVRGLQIDSYVDRIVEHELPENGMTIRRPRALRAWLAAYGAATATDAAYSRIVDAATAGDDDKPARQTVDGYREHLQRIFVLDPVQAWTPAFAPLRRLTKTPKHHLVDPAIAARLAGVDAEGLLRGLGTRVGASTGTWLGALFESLATQSVRVYAAAADADVGHLRSADTSREVDLIVEDRGLRVVGIEVKLAGTVSDRDVRHLNWLDRELGDRLADKIVITTGPQAYRRPDGVAVVPLALLGP